MTSLISSTSILGHAHQLDALKTDLTQENVAHAYLFAGPKSVGKMTIAQWFARNLLTYGRSEEEIEGILAQADRLLHPDLLVIDQLWMEEVCEDPEIIAKSSNISQQHRIEASAKTDTISIDDIRALQSRMHEVASGRFRCCIIRSVERMQDAAVNALLKILEEPPPGVTFLLTTQSLQSLPLTLISRSRVIPFSRLRDAELQPLLTGTDDDEARFLIRVAQGAPGVVQRLRRDTDQLRKEKQAYSTALLFWHSRSPLERLQLLAPLHERSPDAQQFLLHLSLACREDVEHMHPEAAEHLITLVRGLQTNVNRQMLTQQFVLALRE